MRRIGKKIRRASAGSVGSSSGAVSSIRERVNTLTKKRRANQQAKKTHNSSATIYNRSSTVEEVSSQDIKHTFQSQDSLSNHTFGPENLVLARQLSATTSRSAATLGSNFESNTSQPKGHEEEKKVPKGKKGMRPPRLFGAKKKTIKTSLEFTDIDLNSFSVVGRKLSQDELEELDRELTSSTKIRDFRLGITDMSSDLLDIREKNQDGVVPTGGSMDMLNFLQDRFAAQAEDQISEHSEDEEEAEDDFLSPAIKKDL